MKSLLILHKKNKETESELLLHFDNGKIRETNYIVLQKMIDDEILLIENEMYSCIETENVISHHFRSIAGMIAVIYIIGLAAIVHNWIVN